MDIHASVHDWTISNISAQKVCEVDELVHQVRALAAKPDNLSSVPGTGVVGETDWLVFSHLQTQAMVHMWTYTQ